MRYGEPGALWILLAAALLLGGHLARFAWRKRRMASVGDAWLIGRLAASSSVPRQVAKVLLLVLAVALLALAAARPQEGGTAVKTRQAGIDVVFAVDISKSMLARDVAPSRLQAARLLIEALLEQMQQDRVALVPFSGIAFAQCPLTRDLSAIRVYLRGMKSDSIPVGGTAVGRAIMQSVQLLAGRREDEGGEPAAANRRAKERAIILITDGEDHDSEPVKAAEAAAAEGIRIYTVGMGSVAGDPIPIYHEDGTLQGYQKDRTGKFVYTRLDEEGLRAVAERTDGLYLPWDSAGGTVTTLSRALGDLQRTELESAVRRHYDERFQYALAPALLLLFLELLLGDRVVTPGRARRRRRGVDA